MTSSTTDAVVTPARAAACAPHTGRRGGRGLFHRRHRRFRPRPASCRRMRRPRDRRMQLSLSALADAALAPLERQRGGDWTSAGGRHATVTILACARRDWLIIEAIAPRRLVARLSEAGRLVLTATAARPDAA
jgi:hypothetical protein